MDERRSFTTIGKGAHVLERGGSSIRIVARAGSQNQCGGIAWIALRAERIGGASVVDDASPRVASAPFREAALVALRARLGSVTGIRATLYDNWEHPIDMSRATFAEAGDVAGAFLAEWARAPLTDDEITTMLAALRKGTVWETGGEEDSWRFAWRDGAFVCEETNRGLTRVRAIEESEVVREMRLCPAEIRLVLASHAPR
jgi:hypothetical protein